MSTEITAEVRAAWRDDVEYVVGFALDNYGRVALIRKNRPEWQAGLLNGIGGHVEPGEDPDAAMVREFEEETGSLVGGWELFLVMDFPGARIHFYRTMIGTAVMDGLRTATDETVCKLDARDLGQVGVIPNLRWLVPLAAYTADTYEPIRVRAAMAEVLTTVTSLHPGRGTPENICWCDGPDRGQTPCIEVSV